MRLLNSFSLGMLPVTQNNTKVMVIERDLKDVQGIFEESGIQSSVGHADTAKLFGNLLGMPVAFNRDSVELDGEAIVGQYTGPRLPEGATTLPEGAKIRWLHVTVSRGGV